jgi:hypothetical protein
MRVTLLRSAPSISPLVDIDDLYRRHAPTVARWAARLGGPGIEVQDVVQDVFMVAGRRLQRFDGSANITTRGGPGGRGGGRPAARGSRGRRQTSRRPGRALAPRRSKRSSATSWRASFTACWIGCRSGNARF